MEEIILLILILLTMLTIFCLYKMLDKRGLYFSLVITTLIAFVLSFKITSVFKMNINIGIVPLIASLSTIYIFITKYGYKECKELIKITLYSNITTSLLIATMNYFIPAITETISINMEGTFAYNYKILITYPIIITISQILVIKLYKLIKQIINNMPMCIMLTYIITGLLYTVIFYIFAYLKTIEIKYSIYIGISSFIIGLVITLINITLIYYITNKKVKQWET